jgi:hypothetical protein
VAVEDRYFGDTELLNRIDDTERELIQGYIGQRLSAEERSAFESYFLRSSAARRKVAEARTVAEYFRRSGNHSRALRISAAASLLLIFAAAAYLAVDTRRTRAEPDRKSVDQQVAVAWLETHTIHPGRQRGGEGQPAVFQLGRGAALLRLNLEMEASSCSSGQCRASLSYDGGKAALVVPVLRDSAGLHVEIPAAYLPPRADCLMEIWDGGSKAESFQFAVNKITPYGTTR